MFSLQEWVRALENASAPDLIKAIDRFSSPVECLKIAGGIESTGNALEDAVCVSFVLSTQIELGLNELNDRPYLEWDEDPRNSAWYGVRQLLSQDYDTSVVLHYGVYGLKTRGIRYQWSLDDIISGEAMGQDFVDALEVYGVELDGLLPYQFLH